MAKVPSARRVFKIEGPPEVDVGKYPHLRVVTENLRPTFMHLRSWICAVDPGETCGVAITQPGCHQYPEGSTVGDLYRAYTDSYDACHDRVEEWAAKATKFGVLDPVLVIEEYRVYPQDAAMHAGKTIPTSECIGGLKLIARRHGIRVVEQPAGIKETTAALLRGRGLKPVGDSRHAKDAEIHLWYHVLRPVLR